ncbi:MAG: XRE family transcriptional regulator [Flavobacterium psychrophilum]|nr:MAG: XRE family transcriptional regulator [Flavobacterium psychrophilum]
MVNTDDFIKRLEMILDYYNLSASLFADKMGVQRSGLSHLMSGRNKPSLDFVMKIIENFPEVDFYWLMNGEGNFPKYDEDAKDDQSIPPSLSYSTPVLENNNNQGAFDLFSSEETPVFENKSEPLSSPATQKAPEQPETQNTEPIERIVVFYKNGTFKSYTPEN